MDKIYQEWVEKICQNNYARLYGIGTYLAQKMSLNQDVLLDAIQDVFVVLCRKCEILVYHPCIEGWLIITLKQILLDRQRAKNREQFHNAFSLDEISQPFFSKSKKDVSESIQEQLDTIEEYIGKDNMRLLIKYYSEENSKFSIANEIGISEQTLRKKVSRLKKKAKKALTHLNIFYLSVTFWTIIAIVKW